jgi:hypothetical protein
MNIKERNKKMEKMKAKYEDNTMFFLEGNFKADRLCEELNFNTPHHAIQIHAASLPRFVIKVAKILEKIDVENDFDRLSKIDENRSNRRKMVEKAVEKNSTSIFRPYGEILVESIQKMGRIDPKNSRKNGQQDENVLG